MCAPGMYITLETGCICWERVERHLLKRAPARAKTRLRLRGRGFPCSGASIAPFVR